MVKKIQVIEIREYVYTPDIENPDSPYAEADVTDIGGALELDKADVEKGDADLVDLGDGDYQVVSRSWRIIDES